MYIFQKAHGALTYLPLLASKAVKVGTALKMSASGGLDLCGETDKPRYISNIETTGDGSLIPVSEITEDTVLIAPLGAAASTIGIGKSSSCIRMRHPSAPLRAAVWRSHRLTARRSAISSSSAWWMQILRPHRNLKGVNKTW